MRAMIKTGASPQIGANQVDFKLKREAIHLRRDLDARGSCAQHGRFRKQLALNIDLSSVMQAGRWRDTRMLMRYGERVLASLGAMARAGKSQGRA